MWETLHTLKSFTAQGFASVLPTSVSDSLGATLLSPGNQCRSIGVSVKFHQAVNRTRSTNKYQGDFHVTENPFYFLILLLFFPQPLRHQGGKAASSKSWVTMATLPPPGYMRKAASGLLTRTARAESGLRYDSTLPPWAYFRERRCQDVHMQDNDDEGSEWFLEIAPLRDGAISSSQQF